MPRNAEGVFTPAVDWEEDETNGTPFSAVRFNEQDADFADALNDLPLKSKTPVVVPDGTDAATVAPGSLMEADGKVYWRNIHGAWQELGNPGLTDATSIVNAAADAVRAGISDNLDTLPEIVALIEQQISDSQASAIGLQVLGAANAAAIRTVISAAEAGHTHTMSQITDLPLNYEQDTEPSNPPLWSRWRHKTTAQIYLWVPNDGDPVWQEVTG